MELELSLIPRRVKNITEISPEAKRDLISSKNKLKSNDMLLCIFTTIIITMAVIDVSH